MNTEELLLILEKECNVRIYFKDMVLSPRFGSFIKCEDYEELLSKRMVRFLPHAIREFTSISGYKNNSKILSISTFKEIKCFDYENI